MAQETVLIDFQVDYTELTNAQAELAKTGKVDTKGFQAIQAAIDNTATDTQGLIKQFKDVAGASIKMGKSVENAFGAGVQDALDEAGVSVDEFAAALKKTTAPAVSLKKEMLALKEALARMKAEGKDTGKEFEALRARAGKLQDAIADANAEIKNAGSDTRHLDNVVGSISALAGGFAAAQGAAALFGDENEDLQKALLKVNGAMALSQGLQVVYNATLKEGSLAKLADSVATGAQSAATTLYTFVMGGATVATKAFRAVLLATGIGAIVVLIVSLVTAMSDFSDSTDDATKSQEDLKNALDATNNSIDDQIGALNNLNNEAGALAKLQGKSAKEQFEQSQLFARREIKLLEDRVKAAQNYFFDIDELYDKGKATEADVNAAHKAWGDAQIAVNNAVSANNVAYINEQIRIKQEEKKLAEDRKAARDKINAELKILKDKEIEYDNQIAREKKKINDEIYLNELNHQKRMLAAKIAMWNKALEVFKKNKDDEKQDDTDFYEAKWDMAAADSAKADKKALEDEARRIRTAKIFIDIASQVANFYSQLAALASEQEFQRIDQQKKQLQGLIDAGAISAKQAKIRSQQIETLEKVARQRAAQREKQAAIFTALLAIPKAFLEGLSQGGYVLAAIYAALAAAQAAIIIARPLPKFFRGKKDSYEGPGIVGDMGSELVERGGRMFLYTKPTQTYLGATDKVYTAAETRQIMHNSNISTTINKPEQPKFDYDRLGKSIPKDSVVINIEKDFISEAVANGLSRNNYFNNRYQFKK